MAKRTSKKSTPRKTTKRKSDTEMPPPHFSEQIMQGLFGGHDTVGNAQEHAYNAMEAMAAQDWDRAHKESMKALQLDPNCVDALTIMSQLGSENKEELIDNLRRTVARGEMFVQPARRTCWLRARGAATSRRRIARATSDSPTASAR